MEADGRLAFLGLTNDGLSPRPADDRSCCDAKLSKICPSQEAAPRRTPGHLPIFCSLCGPSVGDGCSVEGMESQFCFRMNSLQRTRNHGAVGAERALSNRASCKLVAAARKWGSVLSQAASSWRDGADR